MNHKSLVSKELLLQAAQVEDKSLRDDAYRQILIICSDIINKCKRKFSWSKDHGDDVDAVIFDALLISVQTVKPEFSFESWFVRQIFQEFIRLHKKYKQFNIKILSSTNIDDRLNGEATKLSDILRDNKRIPQPDRALKSEQNEVLHQALIALEDILTEKEIDVACICLIREKTREEASKELNVTERYIDTCMTNIRRKIKNNHKMFDRIISGRERKFINV